MLKTFAAAVLFALAAACGSPFEQETELGSKLPARDSAPMSDASPEVDVAADSAPDVDSGVGPEAEQEAAAEADAAPKDSSSPEVWHPDAGPPPDAAPPNGNACVISIGSSQYQVSLVPSTGCPSHYSVDWESPCMGSGECSCDTCTVPWPAGCSCYSCTLEDATSCVPGTPCTVNAPEGLNAIRVGSMISGTCQYVVSPNEGT